MSKIIHTPEDDESRQIPAIFLGNSQTVSVSGSSAQSGALGNETGLIRITASTNCFISIGVNPTASSSSTFLPAGAVEYFGVSPGEKIAAIQFTDPGIINITEAG